MLILIGEAKGNAYIFAYPFFIVTGDMIWAAQAGQALPVFIWNDSKSTLSTKTNEHVAIPVKAFYTIYEYIVYKEPIRVHTLRHAI